MIESWGSDGGGVTHGIEAPIRNFSGAQAARVVAGGNMIAHEHSHDWPVLSLYVLGGYRKVFDGGEVSIEGPSAVLHASGKAHRNQLGDAGLEQIDLQFDPAWLAPGGAIGPLDQVRCWVGGTVAAAAGQLAALWSSATTSETCLASETGRFLQFSLGADAEVPPPWFDNVASRLQIDCPPTANELAAELGLHPSWLAQAYRRSMGEGLRQTLRRKRVEYATILLRTSDLPAAEIACAAGFCDQSHMNRAFHALLHRTPARIRAERQALSGIQTFECIPREAANRS